MNPWAPRRYLSAQRRRLLGQSLTRLVVGAWVQLVVSPAISIAIDIMQGSLWLPSLVPIRSEEKPWLHRLLLAHAQIVATYLTWVDQCQVVAMDGRALWDRTFSLKSPDCPPLCSFTPESFACIGVSIISQSQ